MTEPNPDVDPRRIRAHAEQFARERFAEALTAAMQETLTAPPGSQW